ncbi:formate/nitrite transporter family protein [Hoeflea sp.]|uniref:formate/nitrite transporter family protein n=1 Tax=Hoeflea sp. TaxID=1940281 RepID=UPI00198A1340|nr:formate/nitrite transporter family protein [Hoeflea sp.]MBC7281999.1 formate/nitrite transporter family protein [Hoeflea sp.]
MTKKASGDETGDVSELVDEAKEKSVDKAARLSPRLIHEVIRRDGEEELGRPFRSLFWSGIAAGILISFSIVGKAMLRTYLPDADWRPLVENFGYSFGFLLVMLGRMPLFTENTIMTVLPVGARPSRVSFIKLARLWGLVLLANVIGCFIAATTIAYGMVLPEALLPAFDGLARHAMAIPAGEGFARAIPAGILIAALVWMLPQAAGSSFWVITLFTWLIGVCGFTHIVAGSVEMAWMLVTGQIGIVASVTGFFLPVLAGNVAGGTLIFAFLAWAQVRQEIPLPKE